MERKQELSFFPFVPPQGLERLQAVTEGVPQSPLVAVWKFTTEVPSFNSSPLSRGRSSANSGNLRELI